MPTLVDSSVWIDYFNGLSTPATEALNSALGREVLSVGDLIVAEVLQGFRHDREWKAARRALAAFPLYSLVGPEVAVASAANFRQLRALGRTVRSTVDCLIATYCLRNDFVLLHSDRDFLAFEELLGLRTYPLVPGSP